MEKAYRLGEVEESLAEMEKLAEVPDDCLEKLTKCDAIHPGYGFLTENIMFRNLCENEQIKFIGPSLDNLICIPQTDGRIHRQRCVRHML